MLKKLRIILTRILDWAFTAILFYLLCFSTLKLLLLFKSPKFYKRIIHKLFSVNVTIFKQTISLYFAILLWIFLLTIIFIVMRMHSTVYAKEPHHEERLAVREDRLKNKWAIESQLWMLTILIIEWM